MLHSLHTSSLSYGKLTFTVLIPQDGVCVSKCKYIVTQSDARRTRYNEHRTSARASTRALIPHLAYEQ